MRPYNNNLLIQPALIPEMTEGGLYIPIEAQNQPNYGIVLESAPNARSKKGDLVYFLLGAMTPIEDGLAYVPEHFCFTMFDGSEPKIENMRTQDGWVLVQIPFIMAVGKQKSGLYTDVTNSSDAEVMVTCRQGTIVYAPQSAVNEKEPIVSSYQNKNPEIKVTKGDKVFFSPYVMNSIRAGLYLYQSYFTPDNGKTHYITIPYRELICVFDDEENFRGLNGYAVCSVKKKGDTIALYKPDGTKVEKSSTIFVASSDTEYYKTGDELVFDKNLPLPLLETEVLQNLHKIYFFFDEEDPFMVNNGSKISQK